MIFAAGMGRRMGALTIDRPKPMITVGGVRLIDHAIKLGRAAGFERIVANVHFKADLLENHLKKSGVQISDDRKLLLETGGGLKAALPLLGRGPVATLNSDAIWGGENVLSALKARWRSDYRALLALVPKNLAHGHAGHGDYSLSADGVLSRGGNLVYVGAQCIDPSDLEQINDSSFSLNRYWDLLSQNGEIHGLVVNSMWCDVGRPENIALAERLLKESHDVHQAE